MTLGWLATAEAHAPLSPAPAAVSAKLLRYAKRIVAQYDVDKDGRLVASEWPGMRGEPVLADLNHDGQITAEEFAQHIANFSAGRAFRLATPASGQLAQGSGPEGSFRPGNSDSADTQAGEDAREGAEPKEVRRDLKFFASLPAGTPPWFIERDTDGDAQLTLSEFSPKLHKSEVDDFNRHDLNRDGILTVPEYLRAEKNPKNKPGGSASPSEQPRAATP